MQNVFKNMKIYFFWGGKKGFLLIFFLKFQFHTFIQFYTFISWKVDTNWGMSNPDAVKLMTTIHVKYSIK